ncbi:hypothetical protein ACOJBO_05270 [Rhizobium beringeri]
MLFDAHWHGVRVFEGVPGRGIYDNMKTDGTFESDGWRVLFFDIGLDLARNDDRRRLRDRGSRE